MIQLSALVVAHDEEDRLAACLERLRFADEIVVVLDRCTDRSRDIALEFGARLLVGAWELEGPRRNDGISFCRGLWILEIDADEHVPPEMAADIRKAIQGATPGQFLLRFDNYVGRRLVRHGWGGSWGKGAAPCLFSKGSKRWGDQRVHPALTLTGEKRWLDSAHAVAHWVDRDVSDMLRRLDRYTSARARDLRDSGDIGGFANNLRRMVSRFLKCFFARGGWREGQWGFLIALMAALYPMISYLKARLEP